MMESNHLEESVEKQEGLRRDGSFGSTSNHTASSNKIVPGAVADKMKDPSDKKEAKIRTPTSKKPKRRLKGPRSLVVTSWILSLALAFSLFQTFTYQPPSHLESMSIDHHHPAKLLLQQQKQKDSPPMGRGANTKKPPETKQQKQPPPPPPDNTHNTGSTTARRTLADVLREAKVYDTLSEDQLESLPALDKTYQDLYGPLPGQNQSEGPIIYGLETCEDYRRLVPNKQERYTGPAGMFNTGTNNVEVILKHNMEGVDNHATYKGSVLYQVPWGKHRMESRRLKHSAPGAERLNQTKCLPVVIIRDPYHWMQSMCKTPYAAHWRKNLDKRCPNLIASAHDKKVWENIQMDKSELHDPENGRKDTETFQLKVTFDDNDVEYFDSLVDLWNLWYRPYWENKDQYPRLFIRHEDMLLHAPTIVEKISECMGIQKKDRDFKYQTNTAKNHGSGTTFLTAIMKTADPMRRQAKLTLKDKIYAAQHLDPELMRAFQYRVVKE